MKIILKVVGGLCFLYILLCALIFLQFHFMPSTLEFGGDTIENSFAIKIFRTAYENVINLKLFLLSLLLMIMTISLSRLKY